MSEPMQRCDNCLKQYPESKMATHFGYCRRNIKKCQKCGQMYDINCQEEHEEEFHKKVKCQYCKNEFGTAQVKKHQSTCNKKTQFCEYCQLNVPQNQFKSHLQACESRTKKCDKCMKPIANKDYLVHLTTCRGVVSQPKQARSYEQYIKNQQKPREQYKQQYEKKPQYYGMQQRKPIGIDFKKKQYPSAPVQPPPKPNYQGQRVNGREKIVYPSKPSTNGSVTTSNQQPTFSRGEVGSRGGVRETNQTKKQAFDAGYKRQQKPAVNYRNQSNSNKPGSYDIIKQPQPARNEVYGGIKKPVDIGKRQEPQVRPPRNQVNPPSRNQPVPLPKYQPQKMQVPKRQQRPKQFDPREYGGYEPDIPQQFLYGEDGYNNRRNPRGNDNLQEDDQVQKAILQSIEQEKKKKKHVMQNVPKQFQNEDLMNTSFYRDMVDIEKQRAEYEQMQRKAAMRNQKPGRR